MRSWDRWVGSARRTTTAGAGVGQWRSTVAARHVASVAAARVATTATIREIDLRSTCVVALLVDKAGRSPAAASKLGSGGGFSHRANHPFWYPSGTRLSWVKITRDFRDGTRGGRPRPAEPARTGGRRPRRRGPDQPGDRGSPVHF